MSTPFRLGIAGLGTVGAGVVKIVQAHGAMLAAKAGRPVEIAAVAAMNRGRNRGIDLTGYAWEDDATLEELVTLANDRANATNKIPTMVIAANNAPKKSAAARMMTIANVFFCCSAADI